MINSTVSKESAPKSLVKLASVTTSFSSTPSLSTIIALTLDAMSDISLFLKIISGQMYKTLID